MRQKQGIFFFRFLSFGTERFVSLLLFLLLPLFLYAAPKLSAHPVPLTGFTVHFDFLNNLNDAKRLVTFAADHGAEIINVVPPAHIWEDSLSLQILRQIFSLTQARRVKVVLTRIDASAPAAKLNERSNYLYTYVLTDRGMLPDGRSTPDYFLATVGNRRYEQWLREETIYYAEHFSQEPNLVGFSVGLFNEPFVSQRGSLLCFDDSTNSYEVAQYTPFMLRWWHTWLQRKYHDAVDEINRRYGTSFPAIDSIPMPINEEDDSFEQPSAAYWDFVCAINDWVVEQYDDCRLLWHQHAKRAVPFILQFSGFAPEKFEKGRPAFAALDIFDWMQRADALGLSLYTNGAYPDWGHASVRAMVNFMRLGQLLEKPVFVLEGGNEFNGAVLNLRELRFYATVARILHPVCVIYEFLKTSYDETSMNHSGKILSKNWEVNEKALRAVEAALELSKTVSANYLPYYVLDDPALWARSDSALEVRKELMKLAMKIPIVFVPMKSVPCLPRGSFCVVLADQTKEFLHTELTGLDVVVISGKEFLRRVENMTATFATGRPSKIR
ncbi:MAG: hypothetical protein ACP5JH_09545 [Bacteroidota bacterium]